MGNSSGKPVVFTDEVNLNHFRLLRVVGKGAFGKVRIVERKDTGLQFALKYIRKDEVVRSDSVRNIIRERRMMQHLNHPFICNLRYSFQDIEYMYLVLDLMTGGDIRFHISRKTFTEEAVRFWMAELGCALRYIHKQGIIHRDVKPDNVLLDSEGHVHLADFNVASDFVPNKMLTSKSGTLAYLAPEVYIGKGYTSGADWWSLGVCFYECIYNKRPFDGSTQSNLSARISEANVNYPITSPPVSNPCLHAISCALEADPEKRMGSAGWHTFIDNPFFRDIDFDALERKEVEPVFVPSGEKTNFDATYDLEELLLEEAPLEARARRQKPREALKEGATDKEIKEEELYRMIETLYEPFDYTSAAYDRYANAMNQMTPGGAPVPVAAVYGNDPDARAIPMNRNASTQRSGAASAPSSVDGSPPIPTMPLPHTTPPRSTPGNHRQDRQPPNFSTPASYNSNANQHPSQSQVQQQQPQMPRNPATQPAYLTKSRSRRPSQSTRSQPSSGNMAAGLPTAGIYIVPADGDTWSDLALKDHTLPADAKELLAAGREKEKPNGMLGFLSRKKGRGHSPKPQERGILSGKEGGRVVVGN